VLVAAITTVALIAALVPFATSAVARGRLGGPAATVRGYLVAAAVDDDGVSACRYLTAGSRARFERASGQTCESYFGARAFQVGGRAIESDSQLAAAHYTVTAAGRDRLVTMTYDGHRVRFRLAPASAVERGEYLAPATTGRIASGATP
jgi:hypothetical protein